MLTVSNKQINTLNQITRARFENTALLHLKEKYTFLSETKTDAQIIEIIKKGISKAARYNIHTSTETLHFLEYTIALGENFEMSSENEWARKILYIRNLGGEEKIKRMLKKYIP
jgi:hypothetical protein